MAPTIAKRVNGNLSRLESGLFTHLLSLLLDLEENRDKISENRLLVLSI